MDAALRAGPEHAGAQSADPAESWPAFVETAESWQIVDAGIVESWIEVVDRSDF
jgi:hypothetical protein